MLNETGNQLKIKTFVLIFIILFTAAGLSAQSLSLSAELDNEEIWLGDSVQLTLYLQGSEEAISPELIIPEVRVEPLGGTVRSSRSVTSINGKVTENIRKAYVYGYRLTPKTAGAKIIPAITVEVEGAALTSRQLVLDVKQPQTSDDFKLELEFDRGRVYLNEECSLKVSFIYEQSLRALEIMIPGLESLKYGTNPGSQNDERYEINLNGSPVTFSRDDRNGKAGLSAVLTIRPDTAGYISLTNATASFESITGYQRVQDFFGRIQNQEVYGRSVIPGNKAAIQVMPFPENGMPDDFFGLSGNIRVDVSVEPDEVHIGDPMTFSLTVSGMNNTGIKIPPLGRYLGSGIDIPDTRSSAEVSGRSKTITQTIRIKDASIDKIPQVSFSYFNTEKDIYEYAVSEAIPIKVLDTKIITATELEGSDSGDGEEKKIMLERKREGIYYNYSGSELLSSSGIIIRRLADSLTVKILLIVPPGLFLLIIIFTILLPQVRAQAEAKVDRSRALKRLKKSAVKSDIAEPKLYLKDFNALLNDFLKMYGQPDDSIKLKEVMMRINSVVYGQADSSSEQARETALTAVAALEKKVVGNA